MLNGTGELLAWNPMGTILATYSEDTTNRYRSAILWEPKSGKRRATLTHIGPTHGLTWSPDGKTIATGSPGKAATLWESGTGKRLLTAARPHGEDL